MTPAARQPPPEPDGVRAVVRECRCPEYVVRCSHAAGDDRVVWLITQDSARPAAERRGIFWEGPLHEACVGFGIPSPPEDLDKIPLGNAEHPVQGGFFSNAVEAVAAFERFEALLARGPEPGAAS